MVGMVAFALAALLFLAFCVSVRQDRRRFQNAVLLGLTFLSAFSAVFLQVAKLPVWAAVTVLVLAFASPALAFLGLGVYLVRNGLVMIRKEGFRPANLLSMLAGLAIFSLIALLVLVGVVGSPSSAASPARSPWSPGTSPSSSSASSATPSSTGGSRSVATSTTW